MTTPSPNDSEPEEVTTSDDEGGLCSWLDTKEETWTRPVIEHELKPRVGEKLFDEVLPGIIDALAGYLAPIDIYRACSATKYLQTEVRCAATIKCARIRLEHGLRIAGFERKTVLAPILADLSRYATKRVQWTIQLDGSRLLDQLINEHRLGLPLRERMEFVRDESRHDFTYPHLFSTIVSEYGNDAYRRIGNYASKTMKGFIVHVPPPPDPGENDCGSHFCIYTPSADGGPDSQKYLSVRLPHANRRLDEKSTYDVGRDAITLRTEGWLRFESKFDANRAFRKRENPDGVSLFVGRQRR